MMIPTALRRFLALFAGVLFLLSGAGEAAGARPCPHHDGGAAAQAGEHGHHGAEPRHPAPAEHAPCSCAGHCATPSGPAVPPNTVVRVEAEFAAAPRALRSEAPAPSPRRLAHLLPYAQAPPRAG
ncbi:MAG TPA: hypothetical protein VF665_14855 [Longimicrobium sp.]